MDYCLKSVATEEDSVTLESDLRTLCASGGVNLKKWMSHSRRLLPSIPEVHRASGAKDLDLSHDALPVERTLRVQWDTDMDAFTYSMKLQDKPVTRRGILSVVKSVYDPPGFLALVVLPAKLMLKCFVRSSTVGMKALAKNMLKVGKNGKKMLLTLLTST